MKRALLLILCFFTITLQAQVIISGGPNDNKLTIRQVLTSKDNTSNSKSKIKILTEEVSTQIHDGKEVYKTKQNVEYCITYKGTKISKKRKILSTNKEKFCSDRQAEQVFPDMTANLLSTVLCSKTIGLEGQTALLPFTMIAERDGIFSIYIDKLAFMKSIGKDNHLQQGRVDLQLVQVGEELFYKESKNKLYIDSLIKIQSIYSFLFKEKSDVIHKVEVKEKITIKDLIK